MEEIQHSADNPVSHRDTKHKCANDGEQQQERDHECGHEFFLPMHVRACFTYLFSPLRWKRGPSGPRITQISRTGFSPGSPKAGLWNPGELAGTPHTLHRLWRALESETPLAQSTSDATLPRVDARRCWQLRYVSRVALSLSQTSRAASRFVEGVEHRFGSERIKKCTPHGPKRRKPRRN